MYERNVEQLANLFVYSCLLNTIFYLLRIFNIHFK